MLTLGIDTSTNLLSVALVRGGEVLVSLDEPTKNNQSEILMSRIEGMLLQHQVKASQLDLIGVAVGPGSYTGIRVGVAAAKSLGYALGVPVVGISSLETMAVASGSEGIVVSMVDARRGTVFAGGWDQGQAIFPEGHYELEVLFDQLPGKEAIFFVGDGGVVHQDEVLSRFSQGQVMAEDQFKRSKATVVAELAKKRSPIKNIHQLVPNYLRKTEAEVNAGV